MSQLPGSTIPFPEPPYYPQEQPNTEDVEIVAGGDVAPTPGTVVVNDPGSTTTPLPPLVADQFTDARYLESAIDSDYIIDEGVLQVPVAGPPGTPCEIIRVHAPMCRRVVQWTAEKRQTPPTVPGSNTGNPNETLGEKRIRPTTPGIDPAGINIYRLSGIYEYLLLLPPGIGDALAAGTTAYETKPSSANNVMPAQFNDALLDSSSTVPAGFNLPPSVG